MKHIPPYGAADPDEAYVNFDPETPETPGSRPDAEFFNTVLAELLEVITHYGLTPDDEDLTQLRQAIQAAADLSALTQGVRNLFLPAKYFTPRDTGGCDAVKTTETATYYNNLSYLAFDKDVAEHAQATLLLPKSWNTGTIKCRSLWMHPAATSFGVCWSFAGVSIGNGEAADAVHGTAVDVVDTGGTAGQLYLSDWSGDITLAGAGDAELQLLDVSRKPTDGGDDLDADAWLLKVDVQLVLDAGNDA